MTTQHCARCLQFTSPLRPHDCPCDDFARRARHRYATALAVMVFAFGGLLLVVRTLPDTPAPRTVSDAVPGQSGAPLPTGFVATPVLSSGAPSQPAASPMTEPSADGYGSGTPVESMPAPDTATILAGGTTRQGVIAYAEPRFGPRYLATPEPRGTWIVICGVRACTEPVQTNDVGPELYLQRRGRIADVSSVVFQAICGELRFGLCPGSYEVMERPTVTPPATESEWMP